eukprot:Skav207021  [mRNA]  locus=scaffold2740:211455:213334:+ [translate_table: standard]
MLQPVDEWVHATSHENYRSILQDGYLKGNHCKDAFFDGILCEEGAPRGTWFNANNYRGGTITVTPYPERVNTPTVKGLAFRPCDLLDATENYQLFKVSEIPRTYVQVKYAIVKESDPYYDWFGVKLQPVLGNEDEFVSLVKEYDGYDWEAMDAAAPQKVMVSVFVVNDDDNHPTVNAALHRPYDIKKMPARRDAVTSCILDKGFTSNLSLWTRVCHQT